MDEKFLLEVKNDIYKLIYEMKRCNSTSRYYQLSTDLNTIYDMCKYLNIDDLPLLEDYSFRTNLNKYNRNNVTKIINDLCNNYDYYFKVSSIGTKLINKFKLNRNFNYSYLLKDYFSEQDGFSLAYDFLNSYNPNISKLLMKVIKNNRALIGNSVSGEDYGTTYCLTETEYPYLIINSKQNINLPFTYVHESGHIYNLSKYKNVSYKIIDRNNIESNYMEVFSNFLELIFADYLKDNNLYIEDVKLVKQYFNLDMANKLEVFHNLIKSDKLINDINYYKSMLVNMFGKVVAYHYYDMYLMDPERTNYDIEQFLINSGNYNNMEVLDKFGLDKEKILDSKVLEKYFKIS